MKRKKKPRQRIADYAVAVETSPEGADIWVTGTPYRLATVVKAKDVREAVGKWRTTHGGESTMLVSPNPAYVDVVRLRNSPRASC